MDRSVSPSTSRRLIASRFWCGVSFGLRPNLTPFSLASARPRGTFENASAFELRRDAKDGEDDLAKVRGRIEERLGQ
jgi:hypothetical protein